MGYATDYFGAQVARWFDEGWLTSGSRLIEFGAQEYYGDQAEARKYAQAFLRRRGCSEPKIEAATTGSSRLTVADIYRALDVDYTAIDVDGAYNSEYFDLNSFAPPLAWRAAFDLVNNEGTIEHLINPINGFQVSHELLKVGGVAVHSIPLTGHRDHGIMYPTVKFYAHLAGINRYEILQSDIFISQSDLDFVDKRFRLLDDVGRPLNPDGMKIVDAWLRFAYRKTRPAEFRVPFDHLYVEGADELGERLSGNFSSYSRFRLSRDKRRDPIGDEFERSAELLERRAEQRRRLLHLANDHRDHARDDAGLGLRLAAEAEREGWIRRTIPSWIPSIVAIAATVSLNGAALMQRQPSWPFAIGFIAAMVALLLGAELRGNRATLPGRLGSRLP